ncbi:cell wall hydrolase [Neorhizobium sp. NPDC001467]|uniref:cell wall hydrolase n=1 Tax=Neorhizobium sp. NPDC001467 TaxID=3390595 RepID=UPI003D0191B4
MLLSVALMSGCTTAKLETPSAETKKATPVPSKQVYHYTPQDRDCLKRAMYFESKRSSRDGFMAVGTVVMNRLTSDAYPDSICEVVAQKNQFAPGVMTRLMDETTAPELEAASQAILNGERHPDVKDAMFFHTSGLTFPYSNMSYVAVAGGNAFYEKRDRDGALQTPQPLPAGSYILALTQQRTSVQETALDTLIAPPGPAQTLAVGQPLAMAYEPLPMVIPLPLPKPGQSSEQAALASRFIYR